MVQTYYLIKGLNYMDILKLGNVIMKLMEQWFFENKLVLNKNKSDYALFKMINKLNFYYCTVLIHEKYFSF